MWCLKNTKKEHQEHYVFVGEEFVVGRKDASLLISNDPSVSRRHAILYIKHATENLANPARKSSLFIRDEGSKYGTFKNCIRVTSEEELKNGDIIKFGQFESEYRVQHVPLIVTTSCLDVSAKSKVRTIVYKLGGHVVTEWQPCCSHLVMSQVKVTIKALCCLVSLKSIVLPQYFEALEKSLTSASIVSPSKFIPPTGESLIDKDEVSFDVNPVRKTIFIGKTFFFMDEKQFKKLHLGIVLGGGNASIITTENTDLEVLLREGTCFIEPVKDQIVTEAARNFLKDIITILKRKNLRMIPESDIGLAVAYSSTEKFCNPNFNVGAAVLGSQKVYSQTLSEREVYVPDTEDKNQKIVDSHSEQPLKKKKIDRECSLNLTSFRNDDVDLVEIPLSAQVKQELDDIFETTVENQVENISKRNTFRTTLPSTLPLDSELEIEEVTLKNENGNILSDKEINNDRNERFLKTQDKVDLNSTKQENSTIKIMDSPKPEIMKDLDQQLEVIPKSTRAISKTSNESSKKTSNFKENRSLTSITNLLSEDDSNLPCNLAKIEFVDLICKRPSMPRQNNYSSSVKNFKKFKKVQPLRAQALPRIIGIHELVPFDRTALPVLNEVWDDPQEVNVCQPVKGEFDWDTPAE